MATERLEARLTLAASQFNDGIRDAVSNLDDLDRSASNVKKSIGLMGGAVAAGAGAAMVKAVGAASDYEDAMVEVEKVTNPDVAREMGDEIKKMAGKMPVAQKALAGIAADAGRFGVEGSDNIAAFTETTAKMATATDLSANEAGEAFARLATLTGEPIDNVQNVGDVINGLSNTMATSSSDIVDSALRSAGTLSQMGASTEDIYALNASMNEVSESSRRAGSRIRRLGQEIQDPGKVPALADALGMTTEEFETMRNKDPVGLIRMMAETMGEGGDAADDLRSTLSTTSRQGLTALSQNLDGLSEAQKMANEQMGEGASLNEEYAAAASTFSNQIQILQNNLRNVGIAIGQAILPHLTSFVKGLNGLAQGFSKWIAKGKNAQLVLQGLAALFAGGLVTALMVFGSTIATVGVALGALLVPVLAVSAALAALAAAWRSDFAGIRTQTMRVASVIASTFGPLVRGAFQTVRAALTQLTAAFSGNGGVIEGVLRRVIRLIATGLIVAIRTLGALVKATIPILTGIWRKHGTLIKTIVTGVVAAFATLIAKVLVMKTVFMVLTPILTAVTLAVKGLALAFSLLLSPIGLLMVAVAALAVAWQTNFMNIRGKTMAAINAIMPLLTKLGQYLRARIPQALRFLQSIVATVMPVIRAVVTAGMNAIRGAVALAMALIQQDWQRAWNIIKNAGDVFVSALQTLIKAGFTAMVAVIKASLSVMQTVATAAWNAIQTATAAALSAIQSRVQSAWSAIKSAISSALSAIQSAVSSAMSAIRSTIQSAWSAITSAVQSALSAIQSAIQSTWSAIKSAISSAMSAIQSTIQSAWSAIKSAISSAMGAIQSAIQSGMSAARSAVQSGVSAMQSAFRSGMNAIQSAASSGFNAVVNAISSGISNAVGIIQSAVSSFQSAGANMMGALADGIKSGVSDAVNAVKNGVDKVRSFLPGSDADRGPLSDLTDSAAAIPGEIISSIEGGDRPAERAMRSFMKGVSPRGHRTPSVGSRGRRGDVVIHLDASGHSNPDEVGRVVKKSLRSVSFD